MRMNARKKTIILSNLLFKNKKKALYCYFARDWIHSWVRTHSHTVSNRYGLIYLSVLVVEQNSVQVTIIWKRIYIASNASAHNWSQPNHLNCNLVSIHNTLHKWQQQPKPIKCLQFSHFSLIDTIQMNWKMFKFVSVNANNFCACDVVWNRMYLLLYISYYMQWQLWRQHRFCFHVETGK